MKRSLKIAKLTALSMLFASSALAEETKTEAKWASVTVQPGLQMWQPLFVTPDGQIEQKAIIGAVAKVHYSLTDMFGIHVRGTYGLNDVDTPIQKQSYSAFAAGLGADFFIALGEKAMWYNTMGLGYARSTTELSDMSADLDMFGAYFVTGFDVKVFGNMGVWMDWGCQVVGPANGKIDAGDVKTFHINPTGAGGMRISF